MARQWIFNVMLVMTGVLFVNFAQAMTCEVTGGRHDNLSNETEDIRGFYTLAPRERRSGTGKFYGYVTAGELDDLYVAVDYNSFLGMKSVSRILIVEKKNNGSVTMEGPSLSVKTGTTLRFTSGPYFYSIFLSCN